MNFKLWLEKLDTQTYSRIQKHVAQKEYCQICLISDLYTKINGIF